jgi:hypothetical protein
MFQAMNIIFFQIGAIREQGPLCPANIFFFFTYKKPAPYW